MGEDGKVIYKVVIDDTGVENEAEAAGRKAGDGVERGSRPGTSAFHEAMVGAARRIGEAFVEMAARAVKGVEQVAQAGIEFNAKMEQYETGFKTLLGSAEEAEKVMSQIREDAAHTPFDVDSLTQANQMLISTGLNSADARNDVLNLANAIAATGGGSAELSRMAANMQQIKNVGKATAMDIRQFAMAGINIYGLLADATGKTTEEVKDMEVSYDLLSAALARAAEAGGMYEGAMEAQSQTFNGRISTLKDNATQLAGSLTEDLFNKLSGTALPMVMDWVATLLEAAQTNGIEGAIGAAKKILSGLVASFLEDLPQMMDTGLTLLEGLIDGITKAIPQIIQVATQIIIIILQALVEHAPDLILAGIELVTTLVSSLIDMRDVLIDAAINLITALVMGLIEHAPELLLAGAELVITLLQGILTRIPELLRAIPEIINRLKEAFNNTDWASIGTNIVTGVWDGIVGLWDWLVGSVQESVNNLWESAKRALGIASPSKKFAYIGEMSVEGTMEGFEDQEAEMTRVVHDIYSGVSDTASEAMLPIGVSYSGYGREDVERNLSYTLSATGTTGGATIIVPLSLDGREIARATAWSMGEQLAWEEL